MNNIIKTHNLDNYNINNEKTKELSLEELGLIYYLKLNNRGIQLSELLNNFNLTIEYFKNLLENLELKNIIKLDIDINEGINVSWNIHFTSNIKEENLVNRSYNTLFHLTPIQEENLKQIKDSKELFLRLFSMFKNNIDSYIPQELVIENLEQYSQNLKSINPLTFMWSLGVKPDVKEVYTLYETICIKNIPKETVNFLIDYTISTSIYKNFSINFFNKVADNWISNNISTLEEAMKYVKEKKKEQSKSQSSKYQDPNWEEVTANTNNSQDYDKLKEIEEMIKGKI